MDSQLKRGIFEACVLKALSKGDSYGYQIIKDVSEYVEISESTLYPILKRLENVELLTVYSVEYNSRLRKYYKITELGLSRIKSFINDFEQVIKIYNYIKGDEENE